MSTEKIDRALERILNASGSSLKNYTMQKAIENMRKEMEKIIKEAYIAGSNDCWKSIKDQI